MKNLFTFTAEVVADIYNAGRTEDGEIFTADRYFVSVSNDYGLRFRHNVFFNSVERQVVSEDDNWIHFEDKREAARGRAERLAARVNNALENGYVLDPAHWYEDAPVYGSDAYINSGEEAKRAFADRLEA
jgi:hypothetical protein